MLAIHCGKGRRKYFQGREAPEVHAAAWESPGYDRALMQKYLDGEPLPFELNPPDI